MAETLRHRLARVSFLPCLLIVLGTAANAQRGFPANNRQPDIRDILAQAASDASTMPDSFDKAYAYQAIARILWKEGDKNQATLFFDCAMTVASNSPSDRVFGGFPLRSAPFQLLNLIAGRADAGDISGALSHVEDFGEQDLQNLALQNISASAAQRADFKRAQQIALSIADTDDRDVAFNEIALSSREVGQFDFSEEITRSIQNDVDRVEALSDLALALHQAGQFKQASGLFAEATRTAETLPSTDEYRHTIGASHVSLIFHNTSDEMLGYIASRQALAADNSGADETLSKIRIPSALEETKLAIEGNALRQANSGEPTPEATTDEISQEPQEPYEVGKEFALDENYSAALALAPAVDPSLRNNFFEKIAEIQVLNGDAGGALEWVGRLDTVARADALIAIAEALSNNQTSN
jgi:tetratricopeptide (TPR) repeat protein